MKGFINRSVPTLCLGLGLVTLAGCYHYREIVDPCWLQRYSSGMARESVREMAFAQTEKGHILDQTIWNWMFETDQKTGQATDRLNAAGIEHLKYISRRLPVPDCHLFIQTAQDVAYVDGISPEKLIELRGDLNNRRIVAIQKFLSTQTMSAPVAYQVAVHDFAPPSIPSVFMTGSLPAPPAIAGGYSPKLENNFQGTLGTVGGAAAPAVGGAGGR